VADISRITEIGVAKCKILSTCVRPHNLPCPQFKYPILLRTLEVYNGFLDQREFQDLVAGARNLHTLTLSSKTYPNFYDVSTAQPFQLPNLRRLTLGSQWEEDSLPSLGVDDRYMTENGLSEILRIFAASSVPRLEEFKLCAAANYIHDVDLLTKHLVFFLAQCARSLRNLRISFPYFIFGNPYPRLRRVSVEGRTVIQSEIENFLSQLEALHLNTFDVKLCPLLETKWAQWARFIDTFEKVANQVTGLNRRCTFYPFYPETPHYAHFIQNNQATLTYLVLKASHFNCGLLTECVHLREFMLYGKPKTREEYGTENFRGIPANPEVVQLAVLPKTLEHIVISRLFVTSTEIATINLDNFPKLKRLYVFEIGEKEDLGMTLKDLSTLVGPILRDKEKVFWLEIRLGINRRSVLQQADQTLNGDHQDFLNDSSQMHPGSEMFIHLAFRGAFRYRHQAPTAVPWIQHEFEFKQNWVEDEEDQDGN